MAFEEMIKELDARKQKALAMGGPAKLAERKAQGVLNARERLDRLFDPGSFLESGLHGVSVRPEDKETTPADGKVVAKWRRCLMTLRSRAHPARRSTSKS